jgi:coenzyme F420-reducing hydrogenase gamma subunit
MVSLSQLPMATSCVGCEIAVLEVDETILKVLEVAEAFSGL